MDEEPVLADIYDRLMSDDIFYDIGANIGIYSCLLGKALQDGNVICFEPHPETAVKCRQNLKLNNIVEKVHEVALTDFKGAVGLSISGEPDVGRGTFSIDNSTEDMLVKAVPGDDFCEEKNAPPPTILKIDVEGEEVGVLRGFERILSRDSCRLVYCEVHPDRLGESENVVWRLFESTGFKTERIHDRGSEYFIRAVKNHHSDGVSRS